MRKIGIVTLNGYYNYGNRLQNYALQEILKKSDFEVETIWIDNIRLINQNRSIVGKLLQTIKNPTAIIKKVDYELFRKKDFLNRKRRFKEFSNKYIVETDYVITERNLHEEKLNTFDFFVTGSDQVWNPHFTKGSPLYFLTFAPPKKRIAYAPSFAISEIPNRYVNDYANWLAEMNFLSVREEAGADIIKRLTEREAEVVADPTMLLSREEWLEVAVAPKNKPQKDFLLTYYLGAIPEETKELISYCEKNYNLVVVNLANHKEKDFYLTDPAEFLDLINSAKLFVTDSFHAVVFSILFETIFVVTDRAGSLPSMNSRITTLLSRFNMEKRHIKQINNETVLDMDFSHVNKILEEERTRANNYLNKALAMKK